MTQRAALQFGAEQLAGQPRRRAQVIFCVRSGGSERIGQRFPLQTLPYSFERLIGLRRKPVVKILRAVQSRVESGQAQEWFAARIISTVNKMIAYRIRGLHRVDWLR